MLLDFILFPTFVAALHITGLGLQSFLPSLQLTNSGTFYGSFPSLFSLFAIGFASLLINFVSGVSGILILVILLPFFGIGLSKLRGDAFKAFRLVLTLSIMTTPLAATMAPGYDGGLYHLPHQKWIRDEAIVIGLANLHGRFGFSSFQEYIGAPLWLGEHFKLLSYEIATFFVSFMAFIYQSINSGHPVLRALAVAISINLAVFNGYVSQSSADRGYTYSDASAGLLFASSLVLGVHLLTIRERGSNPNDGSLLFGFIFLSAMSFALKASSIVTGVWVVIVVFELVRLKLLEPRQVLAASVIPVLFLFLWLLRGFLTTGCLLYPASWSCINVSWSAEANAINDANWVTASARDPNGALFPLEGWSWLWKYWLSANTDFGFKLAIAAAIVFGASAVAKKFLAYEHIQRKAIAIGATFVLAALIFWFIKTPNPRFGAGVFIVGAPVAAVLLFGVPVGGGKTLWRTISLVLIGLVALRLDGIHLPIAPQLPEFDSLTVPTPEVVAAEPFGVRPIQGDQCWLVEHCAPYARPQPTVKWGYRLFSFHSLSD